MSKYTAMPLLKRFRMRPYSRSPLYNKIALCVHLYFFIMNNYRPLLQEVFLLCTCTLRHKIENEKVMSLICQPQKVTAKSFYPERNPTRKFLIVVNLKHRFNYWSLEFNTLLIDCFSKTCFCAMRSQSIVSTVTPKY